MIRIIIYTIVGMIVGPFIIIALFSNFNAGDLILGFIGGGILGAVLANYLNKKNSTPAGALSGDSSSISTSSINSSHKIARIILWVILAFLLLFFVVFVFGGVDAQPILNIGSSLKKESSKIPNNLRMLWWKKLVVEESGFEIKYPRDWEAREEWVAYDHDPTGYGIGFTIGSPRIKTGEMDSIALTIINLNSPPWPYNLGDLFPGDYGNAGTLVVGGKLVTKSCSDDVYSSGCDIFGFNFTEGGYSYRFRIDLRATNGKNMDTIDRILSTFRFTDIIQAENWQTYRNEKYGFEFRYPDRWRIIERGSVIGLLQKDKEPEGDYFGDIYVYINPNYDASFVKEFHRISPISEYNLNGVDVVVYRNIPRDIPDQSGYGEAFFTKNDLTVSVRHFWGDDQDDKRIFDQITYSTFQFTR